MIGWVENIVPLKDFLKNALTETEEKHYTYICCGDTLTSDVRLFRNGTNWHEEWLKKFNSDRTKAYKEMYK